ncbi:MAG TPA: right-handed parallel beta-helix repeat-containing protein [Desulfuromonadaceae bacterium]
MTLTAGTRVTVSVAENTKTDPEYLSPLTEITIRGNLKIDGNDRFPVTFSAAAKTGGWAGIIIDGGTANIKNSRISDADTAIQVFAGSLNLFATKLTANRYGLVAQGAGTHVNLNSSRIEENDYGLFILSGAIVDRQSSLVERNRKKDFYQAAAAPVPPGQVYTAATSPLVKEYNDEALAGETVWQGRIRVNGIIRIPEEGRLIILPGTLIEFTKKDTNNDGIGENGLLIQGRLVAKGTRQAPIVFRSAEKNPKMGDWDSINIMNSDGSQNLIEYCQIENAYRGAHFHFSNLAITNSIFRDNYRGIQFQESAVELKNSWLYANKSGIQGRDSAIIFSDNQVSGNYDGANFFRVHLTAQGNRFVGNIKEGLRLRDSTAVLTKNLVAGNRFGVMVADTVQGGFSHNVISANSEIGFSLKNVDNLELSGNFFTSNGFNGLNIQETRATVQGNLFAGNGQRGIGILSFTGLLGANNFSANGLFAIDYEGTADLTAPDNWWGGDAPEKVIGDKQLDPRRGRLTATSVSQTPHHIVWPLQDISGDQFWAGAVQVDSTATVPKSSSLRIAPGSGVFFAKGTGLTIKGRLIAEGSRDKRITFTASNPKDEASWDEIILEYSEGSRVAYCLFEYATWGLHSHFTNLTVTDSLFRKNYGGMRFRSGPMLITRSVFTGNTIGIRSYRGNAVIRENLITDNETGIFVREKGSGLKINDNNLAGNTSYGVRIGDFNDEDVSAQWNWWGTGSGSPLQYVFDGRTEPGIGNVLYEPYRREPLLLKWMAP